MKEIDYVPFKNNFLNSSDKLTVEQQIDLYKDLKSRIQRRIKYDRYKAETALVESHTAEESFIKLN